MRTIPVTPHGVTVRLARQGVSLHYLVEAYDDWSGERKRFQRCVPYSNGYALLEAIREGVNGRVMGGEWVEVVHE